MGDGAERREARRFTMNLPMRVLRREDKERELDAHTRDVSYRGLYDHPSSAGYAIGRCQYPLPGEDRPCRADRQRSSGHRGEDRAIRIHACHRDCRLKLFHIFYVQQKLIPCGSE